MPELTLCRAWNAANGNSCSTCGTSLTINLIFNWRTFCLRHSMRLTLSIKDTVLHATLNTILCNQVTMITELMMPVAPKSSFFPKKNYR